MTSNQNPPGQIPAPDFPGPSIDDGRPAAAPLHAILDDPEAFRERADELRRRRPGFPDRDQPAASLLDALVWFFKLPARQTLIEATAKARRPTADVEDEELRVVDEELERVGEAADDFAVGLRLARAAGSGELTLDAREPELDRIAAALIENLVATEFATVRTEELPGEQYRYHIAVDWPRLDGFATRVGLPAPSQPD